VCIGPGFYFFTTDSEGSLYVGVDMGFRIQKFVPGKHGNHIQIIGPLNAMTACGAP
jgi:hypothetical protein